MKRVNRSGSKHGDRVDSVQPKLPLQEPVSPRRALIRKCMAAILLVGLAVIVVGLAVASTLFISALIVQPSAEDDGTEETAEPLELQLRRRYSPKATSPSVNATLRRQRLNLCVQSPRRESLSCVPRAFILGAEQASAHGVFRALRETEAILGPSVKEYAFYSRTERWLQGWELLGWMYRGGQQLVSAQGMRLLDPSDEYLGSPFAAERIYLSVRDSARFVVMLRDPVDRALDQFFLERGLDSTAEDNFGYIKHQERVNVTLGEVLAEELAVLQLCAAGSVPVQSKKPASVEMNMGPMAMKDREAMTDDVDGHEKVEDTEVVSKARIGARGVVHPSSSARASLQPPNGYGLPDGLHSVVGDCLNDCTQCHPTGTPHMVRRDGGILAKGKACALLCMRRHV